MRKFYNAELWRGIHSRKGNTMLEINCNKCENLIDKVAGCKLYGADPAKAAKACRADLFMNYNPKKEKAAKAAKLTPGAHVWIVERDEDGYAYDVTGFLYLAEVAGTVIVTPKVYGCDSLEEIMRYHSNDTADDNGTVLGVYPAIDCYTNKAAAHAAPRQRGEG